MFDFKGLRNTVVNIKGQFFKIASNICLVCCTFLNINSAEGNGLGDININNVINKGLDMGGINGPSILNNVERFVFPGGNNAPVVQGDNKEGNICILFHGVGDTATGINNAIGKEIARLFNCTVISLEYNNFKIREIDNGINGLLGYIKTLNIPNGTHIIVMGYSLGVNIAAVFANKLKEEGYEFDFIGYKGYENLYSVIEGYGLLGNIGVAAIEQIADSDKDLKNVVEMTDNASHLKKLGLNVEILNEGLAEGHLPSTADIQIIHEAYKKLKNENKDNHFILLCQAEKDDVVGKGMQHVYNKLKGITDEKSKDKTPAASECCITIRS